jgi:hypothetical protein
VQESGSAFEGVGGLANCSLLSGSIVTKLPVEKLRESETPGPPDSFRVQTPLVAPLMSYNCYCFLAVSPFPKLIC